MDNKHEALLRRSALKDDAIQRIAAVVSSTTDNTVTALRKIADEMLAYAGCRLVRVEEQCRRCLRHAPTHVSFGGVMRPYRLHSMPLTGLERHMLRAQKTAIFVALARVQSITDADLDSVHIEMWQRAFEEAEALS